MTFLAVRSEVEGHLYIQVKRSTVKHCNQHPRRKV